MGDEESKPSFPHCAVLNFQPPANVTHSSIVNIDNAILLLRTISSVVPLLKMVQRISIPEKLLKSKESGDKVLLFLANGWALQKIFIEAKVSSAKSESAISLLRAEMQAILNRRNRMLNSSVSEEDKKFEVVPALHSCEKILELFRDQSHCFWTVPIPSSEYLLSFSTLYLECLCLALYLMPSYHGDVRIAVEKICGVLRLYQTKCVQERLQQTYCHVNPGGPRPTSDEEIVELIRKMKDNVPISNNPRYATSFGDNWPSISFPSGLKSWVEYVTGHRFREVLLIDAMESFLQYRQKTRQLYVSKFEEVINTATSLL